MAQQDTCRCQSPHGVRGPNLSALDHHPTAGAAGPLDCIARIAPRLRTLSVDPFYDEEDVFEPPFLSAGASLPPSLEVSGLVEGLGPHFYQLESLRWHPVEEEPYVSFPGEAIHGLSQVGGPGRGCAGRCATTC